VVNIVAHKKVPLKMIYKYIVLILWHTKSVTEDIVGLCDTHIKVPLKALVTARAVALFLCVTQAYMGPSVALFGFTVALCGFAVALSICHCMAFFL
jgi:hypothetical protein